MELRTEGKSPEKCRWTWAPGALRGLSRNTLRVADVMSKDVVTATAEDTLLAVAQQMLTQSISCVVVTHKGRVVGILTEKDMLDLVAGGGVDLQRVGVSERMSSPVDTIAADASLLEADRMMETMRVRRLPVVENGRLAGIVTQTDITRALTSLNSLGGVSDIMTRHVVTVPIDATAMEAARMMSCAKLSCLIVTREAKVVGILTEKDLLKRVIALQKDPAQARVLDVMSLPVVTIPSTCSILDASRKMETMHFHRLLVSDEKGICGLVTQTDIMQAVRESSEAAESQQRLVKEELADLLQHAVRDLQRVRDFLGGIPRPSAEPDLPAGIEPSLSEQTISYAASSVEES